jgi:CBS domain-containing protein
MTVAAILKRKGADVAAVGPDETIADVTRLLAARRIGAVVVMNDGGHLLGILSERDIVRALAEHGPATLHMAASALMTREVITATPRTSVAEAMAAMSGGRFRHLPVVEGGRLAGLVSIGDIVKARMDTQATEVDSLKAYVAGAA